MRALVFAVGIAAIVFLVSGGHFIFIPFLLLPFGFFGFGRRRRR